MSSRWIDRFRHTLGFRLAAWYAALFVGSSVAVAGLTYVLLGSSLRERDRESIRSTLLNYATRYDEGGVAAVPLVRDVDPSHRAQRTESVSAGDFRGEAALFLAEPREGAVRAEGFERLEGRRPRFVSEGAKGVGADRVSRFRHDAF